MDGWKSLGVSARAGWCVVLSSLLLTVTVPATGQVPPASGPPQTTAVPAAPAPTPPPSRSIAPAARDAEGKGILVEPTEPRQPSPPTSVKARWALLIGNAAYEQQPLTNPVNDAVDLGAVLTSLGWRVTVLTNKNDTVMKEAVATFINQIRPGDDRMFYFSGHGVQVNGENYLLPVGRRFDSQQDVIHLALSAAPVLQEMANRGPGVSLFILDACRDNPLPATARGGGRGLAPINATQRGIPNSLIAYATAPGDVASDGEGRNGTYTAALLMKLAVNAVVTDILFSVRLDVRAATDGKQTPWESNSLTERFRFTPDSEPLAVELQGAGQFIVHQKQPQASFPFRTLGTPSDVRTFALNAYAQSSTDWPQTLANSLAELDEAIRLLGDLDKRIEEVADGAECASDRLRLREARSEAQTDRANAQPRGAIVGIRAALKQGMQDGCPPSVPWQKVAVIGAGAVAAASVITATVFFTIANGKWDDAQESCTDEMDNVCFREGDRGPELSREAKDAADMATVFYSVSAVAIVGGLAAYFFWPETEESVPGVAWAIPSLDVQVSRESTQVSARVRF